MITRSQMQSRLSASASYFGGAGSAAYRFLTLLLTNVGILGQTLLLTNLTTQTTAGAGTGASTDRITFDGTPFVGDEMVADTAGGQFLVPGTYLVDYSITVTDVAGGESLQLYINGAANGSTGAVPGSRSRVNYADADVAQLTGKARVVVTAADVAAGIALPGVGASLSLRNVSAANITLPTIAAAGNAIVGTNATLEVRRVA